MSDPSLYTTLTKTATSFVLSTSPATPGTNIPDRTTFLSLLAPTFHLSFGHKFMVSTKPPLQSVLDGEGFLAHQGGMAKMLESWKIEPTGCCVDVEKKSAVVRADFYMTARGQESVLNDILFWIEMDEGGTKVVSAVEFVDGSASEELGRRMMAGKQAQN